MKKNKHENITKILVTGTKGKTSVTNIINYILTFNGKNTLLVDWTGAYLNNNIFATQRDSIINTGKSTNVKPGRYIFWGLKNLLGDYKNSFAVLEASFSCSKYGTGVSEIDVGIFTNIYYDHINGTTIKTQYDLYEKKSFIFKEIRENGNFISFLDNKYTFKALNEEILKDRNINKYGVSVEKELGWIDKNKKRFGINWCFLLFIIRRFD